MEEGSISCIAVGDMLKKRLEEYTEALTGGADDSTLSSIENDIDRIEAVHEKCKASGVSVGVKEDVVGETVDVPGTVVDEVVGDDFISDSEFMDEEDGN